jgi:hypothetical protein
MSDVFDPMLFLQATTEQASERREPLPVGDYTAVIGEVKAHRWTSDKEDAKVKSGIRLEVPLQIQIPPEIIEKLGYDSDSLTVRDSLMLDVTADGRSLDYSKGKNNQLRFYREATGKNQAGAAFAPANLQGCVVLVKIKHEIYNGVPQEKVAGVAKMG